MFAIVMIAIIVSAYIAEWLFYRNQTKRFMIALDHIEKIFEDDLDVVKYCTGSNFIIIASKWNNRVYFNITKNLSISIQIIDGVSAFEEFIRPNRKQKEKIDKFKQKFGFSILKTILPRPYLEI